MKIPANPKGLAGIFCRMDDAVYSRSERKGMTGSPYVLQSEVGV